MRQEQRKKAEEAKEKQKEAEKRAKICEDVVSEKLFSVNSVYTNPCALWDCLHSDMFFLFHAAARHQADRERNQQQERQARKT